MIKEIINKIQAMADEYANSNGYHEGGTNAYIANNECVEIYLEALDDVITMLQGKKK